MSDIAIKVENISKKYQIGENKQFPTLRDRLMEIPNRIFKGPKKTKEFWALRDVTFDIMKGEIVGIIGRNGAGKSTLLKILARITEPTSGRVTMHGRVASMLEVGTGFNQELTGRENIYLNGAIIGMTKKEIESKFDNIVDFSGVGKFLDTPVKHYSSGMYVRLAFAVAAHLDADILLVDEVLAVGDAEFQKKCIGKISNLADSGRTIILVSHNAQSILELCNKVVYLDNGTIKQYGRTEEIMPKYLTDYQRIHSTTYSGPLSNIIKIKSVSINKAKDKTLSINPHDDIHIRIEGISLKTLDDVRITLSVYSNNVRIFTLHDSTVGTVLAKGIFHSNYSIPKGILRPGQYDIYVGGHQVKTRDWFYGEQISSFNILPLWSNPGEEFNIGLINIKGDTSRD